MWETPYPLRSHSHAKPRPGHHDPVEADDAGLIGQRRPLPGGQSEAALYLRGHPWASRNDLNRVERGAVKALQAVTNSDDMIRSVLLRKWG